MVSVAMGGRLVLVMIPLDVVCEPGAVLAFIVVLCKPPAALVGDAVWELM